MRMYRSITTIKEKKTSIGEGVERIKEEWKGRKRGRHAVNTVLMYENITNSLN